MNFEHRCRACQVIGKHVEHCVWRLRGGPRVGPRPRRTRGVAGGVGGRTGARVAEHRGRGGTQKQSRSPSCGSYI